MKILKSFFIRWEFTLFAFLLIELLVFDTLSGGSFQISNILYSMNDFIYICLAAIPMTMVIITGGIDVSTGSIMGLSSIITGFLWKDGFNIWVAFIISLGISALAGLLNGLIVAYTDIQPLIVTLGSMLLFSGIALVISGSSNTSDFQGISGFPTSFTNIANGSLGIVPLSIFVMIVEIILFVILLHYTKYGRYVYLIGINSGTAKFSGINTKFVIMGTYILSGLGGGISGNILTSYLGSARSDLGSTSILAVITAVVLGGTSIFGGTGTIIGTAIASVVIGFMQFGLQTVNVSSQETDVVVGSMLIVATLLRQMNWDRLLKWIWSRVTIFRESES